MFSGKDVSAADSLLSFVFPIVKIIEPDNIVQTALLDLTKAFDSISHDILIEKLKIMAFDSDAQNLIKSVLSNRPQRVKLS